MTGHIISGVIFTVTNSNLSTQKIRITVNIALIQKSKTTFLLHSSEAIVMPLSFREEFDSLIVLNIGRLSFNGCLDS